MKKGFIQIKGARTHNLKNINVDIPINKITCIYGPSGSGKSSLAFSTLLAESKRRFMNSLPNGVKFFWNLPSAADVDSIGPVLPAWGLAQSNPIVGSRPTVIDTMGLSDHIQKYYADFSIAGCPKHKIPLTSESLGEELYRFFQKYEGRKDCIFHLFLRKDRYIDKWGMGSFPSRSYSEDKGVVPFCSEDYLWEFFRFKGANLKKLLLRLDELCEGDEFFIVEKKELESSWFKLERTKKCRKCSFVLNRELGIQDFTPYNPVGACPTCKGHGMNLEYTNKKMVRNPSLSIEEGAIHLLNSTRFSHFLPILIKELKKRKVSVKKSFEEIETEDLWDKLWNGIGPFPGLTSLLSFLETKKYKKNVRIYLRSFQDEKLCFNCKGVRVSEQSRSYLVELEEGRYLSYQELLNGSIDFIEEAFSKRKIFSKSKIEKARAQVIRNHVSVARKLSLDGLSIKRKSKNLETSEYQRCLLAKVLSYEGAGSLFILDEPSLGLSRNEKENLFDLLEKLKCQGNTIILVEHSEYLKKKSDYLIEMGPSAGIFGGDIISMKKNRPSSLKRVVYDKQERTIKKKRIKVKALTCNEVKIKNLIFPKGELSFIHGNSKIKKKEFILHWIANTLYYQKNQEPFFSSETLSPNVDIDFDYDDVLIFESKQRRSTGRSSVGTLTGLSPIVRKYFADLPVSKLLELEKGHFSPNSELGRCPTCEGRGDVQIEMNFMEDENLICSDCQGMRLRPLYARISDGEITAHQAFNGPLSEILPKITLTPKFKRIWEHIKNLKLDYLSLDRSLSSLSGGERQRVKLLSSLGSEVKNSILFFENISAGLSKIEIKNLIELFEHLKQKNNTLILIDQSDLLRKEADFDIDLLDYISK